jgi:hypothetical protein
MLIVESVDPGDRRFFGCFMRYVLAGNKVGGIHSGLLMKRICLPHKNA